MVWERLRSFRNVIAFGLESVFVSDVSNGVSNAIWTSILKGTFNWDGFVFRSSIIKLPLFFSGYSVACFETKKQFLLKINQKADNRRYSRVFESIRANIFAFVTKNLGVFIGALGGCQSYGEQNGEGYDLRKKRHKTNWRKKPRTQNTHHFHVDVFCFDLRALLCSCTEKLGIYTFLMTVACVTIVPHFLHVTYISMVLQFPAKRRQSRLAFLFIEFPIRRDFNVNSTSLTRRSLKEAPFFRPGINQSQRANCN